MTENKALRWYNKLSWIHDWLSFGDWPYRKARAEAIAALNLQSGDVVIDLFCGTGVNFPLIMAAMSDEGQLIGIDGSAGMLAKARRRIAKAGWPESRVRLLERDLLHMGDDFFRQLLPTSLDQPPKLLITLALGIFPDYETIFTNICSALPAGTLIVILEGFCEDNARGKWLIDLIGHSDCSRRVWEPMKQLTTSYQEDWFKPPFRYIDASLIVASGFTECARPIARTSNVTS
ncbi:MAG: methyltransferase domain-containing protein [Anaerolineales bacterium]|nr:methyltransferase domain-containing protein [Anaerolineales bacterium]MCB0026462.1 methyltransferase domain-containing protein [Anaerolineales bacterium]